MPPFTDWKLIRPKKLPRPTRIFPSTVGKTFAEALAHVSEAKAVLDPKVVDEEERDQQMDQLADTEPSFSFEFVDDQIRLEHKNIENAQVRFYPMEVELLFSRQPFAKNDADHFTLVSPDGEDAIKIAKGTKQTTYRLPENTADKM